MSATRTPSTATKPKDRADAQAAGRPVLARQDTTAQSA
jgi:hypothetical protein